MICLDALVLPLDERSYVGRQVPSGALFISSLGGIFATLSLRVFQLGARARPLLLIQKLPHTGPWAVDERVTWLKMLAMAFQITYGQEPNIEIKKEAAN